MSEKNPLSLSKFLSPPPETCFEGNWKYFEEVRSLDFFQVFSKKFSTFRWKFTSMINIIALSLFRAVIGKEMFPYEGFLRFWKKLSYGRKTFIIFQGCFLADLIDVQCSCPQRLYEEKSFAKKNPLYIKIPDIWQLTLSPIVVFKIFVSGTILWEKVGFSEYATSFEFLTTNGNSWTFSFFSSRPVCQNTNPRVCLN